MNHPESITAQGIDQFTFDEAEAYIQTAREIYRSDIPGVDYRGRRSEMQQVIAAESTAVASEFFDSQLEGVMAYAVAISGGSETDFYNAIPAQSEEAKVKLGDTEKALTLVDMRQSWTQLWVGFSILTERLGNSSRVFNQKGFKALHEMKDDERYVVMQQMFNDFQAINALRFGADSVGITKSRKEWDENWEPVNVRFDIDKAKDDRALSARAARLGYTLVSGARGEEVASTHTAGKISPEEAKKLRREFPELPTDKFMQDINFYKDVISLYRSQVE